MAIQVLQRIFKFRTCSLDIDEDDSAGAGSGRVCCTASANAPLRAICASTGRVSQADPRLRLVLEGKKDSCCSEMEEEMQEASEALQFEKAARLRDDIEALQNLGLRGDVAKHVQPEVFPIDPKKGLDGLQQGARPGQAAADHRGRGHRPPGRRRTRWRRW